jgi:YHS domain-containing protein
MDTLHQKDPVCGMDVEVTAVNKSEFEGNLYYFCSKDCQEKFEKDPGLYIEKLGIRDMEHSAV